MTAADGIFLAQRPRPLDGPRLAVKDLLDTADLPTTYGSSIFIDHIPVRTAEAVRRAEAAGWVVNGKTNLHEFAYGVSSQNPHFGTVPNPVAPGRLAGGSSGGSAAAVAAELADAALGTDSGGSIRIPAAWCGLVGFKPTFDLVPTEGCFPLAPSYDHVGPIAATVEACAELMCGLVPGFATPELDSLADVRAGLAWLESCDALVRSRVEAAASFFPHIVPLEFPSADADDSAVFRREVAEVHRPLFLEHAEEYGTNVRVKVERCLAVEDSAHQAGLRARASYRERAEAALAGLDLLVTPTIGFVAPLDDVDELEIRDRAILYTYPFNSLGWPALAIPCGEAEDGLAASIQIVGRPGDDQLVLAVGRVLSSLVRGTAPG